MDDVGEYHAEPLIKDGKIEIYLVEHDGKDAAPDGFTASVLITSGSKREGPFQLTPAGGTKLESAAPGSFAAGLRAVLTLPHKAGKSAQDRYELK